jgi:mono/diheme cytochrome c family protein
VWLHRWVSTRASRRAYRLALAACVVVTAGAAHFGGMLTHGSTTPFGRLASALRGNGDASTAVAAEAVMGATFVTTVAPILETHCQECHGPEKQKHGLRLDSREAALKGGESGKPAIVPGDAMASVLVEAITLPPTNERAMPPEGKPRLSPEQVVTLIDWINRGAEWADATQRASIGVEPPPPHALAELRKAGFQVAPLARGISLVRVDVVPPDARLAALRPIAEQIAWLDLSGKVLEPGESAELAAMPNLTRLELQRSNVGDDDLRQVASLPRPPSTACSRHRTSASAWPATGSTWSATPTPTGTTRTSTATSTRTATGSSTRSTRTCRSIASPSSSSRAISCRRRQSRSVWPPATTG